MPRILVYGAGAIGAYLGALLADAGHDVTLLARGAQADALERDGVRLAWHDGREQCVRTKLRRPGAAPQRFDTVLVTLKATQLAGAAADIAASVTDDGSLVMIQNGLPWWYFERVDSPWRDRPLHCVDPQGELRRHLNLDRVVGAVIYRAVTTTAPGRLFLPEMKSEQLWLGEVDNHITPRLHQLSRTISDAGMRTMLTSDIRAAMWRKLLVNLVWNPLCTLTQSSPGHIAEHPGALPLVERLLAEAVAVAAAVGVVLQGDATAELQRVHGNFVHQPSMWQDLRAGRALEVDAILNTVIELAALAELPVPTLATVATCASLLDRSIVRGGVKDVGATPA